VPSAVTADNIAEGSKASHFSTLREVKVENEENRMG
jgi:hypothetical protein